MKTSFNLVLVAGFIAVASCTSSPKETATDGTLTENTNQVLYGEAIDIHDEVMPEMGSLMGLKRRLKDTLATPNLTAEQKLDFEARVKLLDSAHNSMMVWMRGFEPPKDTTEDQEYRQYIEQKLEDAKKMKALILEAIEKGKL